MICTTRLARAYDEKGPSSGVPFVNHFPIGGGLCAQAVCFAANALCHKHARGVFGISEITYLASGETGFIDFSGLTSNQIEPYFHHEDVGLGAITQRQFNPSAPPDQNGSYSLEFKRERKQSQHLKAVQFYLQSGIPVVARVQFSEMKKVCEQLPKGVQPGSYNLAGHCVLIVGMENDVNGEVKHFWVNDPSTFPFLKVEPDDLWNLSKDEPIIYPVTPADVQAGLLDRHDVNSNSSSMDLFSYSYLWQVSVPRPESIALTPEEHDLSRWLLLFKNQESIKALFHSEEQMAQFGLNSTTLEGLQQLLNSGLCPGESVWLQYAQKRTVGGPRKNHYWLWDATSNKTQSRVPWVLHTQELPEVNTWKHYMADGKQIDHRPGKKTLTPIPKRSADGELPAITVITSFLSTSNLLSFREVKSWEEHPGVQLELYTWMQPEIDHLLKHESLITPQGPLNAVEFMAYMSSFRSDDLAKKLDDQWKAYIDRIVGLATFIPEISGAADTDESNIARNAITFLGKFALAIRKKQEERIKSNFQSCRLQTVELVTGSKITGVYQKRIKGSRYPELIAKTARNRDVRRRVLENIEEGLLDQNLRKELKKYGISFLLELEPGPLFALRDRSTLEAFCKAIDTKDVFRPDREDGISLGVNLDVSHFIMANISPEWLYNSKNIFNRIGHVHMSGHDQRGHFGDRKLTEEDRTKLEPWMDLVCALFAREKPKIPYSGNVSIEFEAARDPKEVKATWSLLKNWFEGNA